MSKSIEELFDHAKNRGIAYYSEIIDKNEKYEINAWKDDKYFDEMASGIKADHKDYRNFFELLINENKDDEALEFLRKLDTRPREYVLMWLKEEHEQEEEF